MVFIEIDHNVSPNIVLRLLLAGPEAEVPERAGSQLVGHRVVSKRLYCVVVAVLKDSLQLRNYSESSIVKMNVHCTMNY